MSTDKMIHHTRRFFKRNSATILTCVGAVGTIGTAVAAVKATPKALALLEEAKQQKGEDLTKMEVVKVAGPSYIPSILIGAATIACIFGANTLNKRQQAALMSAYALLDSSHKNYKKKMVELYGEQADHHVKAEVAKDKYDGENVELEDEEELFYDDFSQRYFTSTKYKMQRAEYDLNREIMMSGGATLNDYYGYLGIDPVPGGDELGWSEGGNYEKYWQSWIDFNHHKVVMDDGLECTIVSFFGEPTLDFDEY